MPPPRDKATPTRVRITQKEAQALELRKAGATFEAIARQLGYASRGTAYHAVKRALDATLREPADALRKQELERLDALQRALWAPAMRGQWLAVDRVLRIMERRAALLGLDAPVRRVLDVVTHDAFAQAMEELNAEIAEAERDLEDVEA